MPYSSKIILLIYANTGSIIGVLIILYFCKDLVLLGRPGGSVG